MAVKINTNLNYILNSCKDNLSKAPFHLFSNIFICYGDKKNILVDIQRKKIFHLTKLMTNILNGEFGNSWQEVSSSITIDQNFKDYIEFLESNEIIFYSEGYDFFPAIKAKYFHSQFRLNLILKSFSILDISKISQKLLSLSFSHLTIIFDDEELSKSQFHRLLELSKALNSDTFNLIINCKVEFVLDHEVFKNYKRLISLSFFKSESNKDESVTMGHWKIPVMYYRFDFDSTEFDTNISIRNIDFSFFFQSQNTNVYWNNLIEINLEGQFLINGKKTPFEFNSDNDLNNYIELIKGFSSISKYKIEVCRDCQYKNICLDRRIPFLKDDKYILNGDCGYNPYLDKHSEEIGYYKAN